MPYIDLTDILLRTDYIAKELSLIEFNSILAKLSTQINTINGNVEYVKNNTETLSENILTFEEDVTTTVIDHTIVNGSETAYSNANNVSVTVTIPDIIVHGSFSGISFNSNSNPTQVTFVNNSIFTLKLIKYGNEVSNYTPKADKKVNLLFYCDALVLYCYILEV